jgi:hypothetical protein
MRQQAISQSTQEVTNVRTKKLGAYCMNLLAPAVVCESNQSP